MNALIDNQTKNILKDVLKYLCDHKDIRRTLSSNCRKHIKLLVICWRKTNSFTKANYTEIRKHNKHITSEIIKKNKYLSDTWKLYIKNISKYRITIEPKKDIEYQVCKNVSDSTSIVSKKYKTIRDLKIKNIKNIKNIIQFTTRLPPGDIRMYLENYLFENHYKKITFNASLMVRIRKISSNLCYGMIHRLIFNNNYSSNINPVIMITDNTKLYISQLHQICPKMTGCFIDYLSRRIICELANIPFDDHRASCGSEQISISNTNIDIDNFNIWKHIDECLKEPLISETHTCGHIECDKSYGQLNYNDQSENIKLYELPICKRYALKKTERIKNHKTIDSIPEIFITSLSHSILFDRYYSPVKINLFYNKIINDIKIVNVINEITKIYKHRIKNVNTKNILLNPSFGYKLNIPVEMCHIPADADLIIDDMLIDIKCTSKIRLEFELLQCLGYASLMYMNTKYMDQNKLNKICIMNFLLGISYEIDISKITRNNYIDYIKFLCNQL